MIQTLFIALLIALIIIALWVTWKIDIQEKEARKKLDQFLKRKK